MRYPKYCYSHFSPTSTLIHIGQGTFTNISTSMNATCLISEILSSDGGRHELRLGWLLGRCALWLQRQHLPQGRVDVTPSPRTESSITPQAPSFTVQLDLSPSPLLFSFPRPPVFPHPQGFISTLSLLGRYLPAVPCPSIIQDAHLPFDRRIRCRSRPWPGLVRVRT